MRTYTPDELVELWTVRWLILIFHLGFTTASLRAIWLLGAEGFTNHVAIFGSIAVVSFSISIWLIGYWEDLTN